MFIYRDINNVDAVLVRLSGFWQLKQVVGERIGRGGRDRAFKRGLQVLDGLRRDLDGG